MFCKKCGTQLHPQARFCKKCGADVTATKLVSDVQPPASPAMPPVQPPSQSEPQSPRPIEPVAKPAPPVQQLAPPKPQPPVEPVTAPVPRRVTVAVEPITAPPPSAPPPRVTAAVEAEPSAHQPAPPAVKAAPPTIAARTTPTLIAHTDDAPPPTIKAPVAAPRETTAVQSDGTNAFVVDESSEAGRGGKRWILIAAIAVVILLAVGAGFWWLRGSGEAKKIGDKPVTDQPSPAPPGMVYVPGGELMMGNDEGEVQERPAHKVAVSPFFIDRTEVTCGEYAKFIAAAGHRAPPAWTGGRYAEGEAERPVTGVDWDDANAYAAWGGKRLPTEQEWEFAARGPEGRRYPWGYEWKANLANDISSGLTRTADVGSYPAGASPYGAQDLVGNAWEWTAGDYVPYPNGELPPSSLAGPLKVIRGSCFGGDQQHATTTFRLGWPPRGTDDYSKTGFRCAKDAEKSGQ